MKYKVVVYDSAKEFDNISNLNDEIYETEEEARDVMLEAAREFEKMVKNHGQLVDIKRLSENSVRIEYVARDAGEGFAIYQVFNA